MKNQMWKKGVCLGMAAMMTAGRLDAERAAKAKTLQWFRQVRMALWKVDAIH